MLNPRLRLRPLPPLRPPLRLHPSPITDMDMVLDTTDPVLLDTPDSLPLLLPGAPKVFVAKGPLNLITVITVNTLGPHTVLPVSQPLPGAPVARGQLTPSPITDTDMVLDTTDTDTWVSLDTPEPLPLLLPGAPKVFVVKDPLKPNLITEVMEVTDMVM